MLLFIYERLFEKFKSYVKFTKILLPYLPYHTIPYNACITNIRLLFQIFGVAVLSADGSWEIYDDFFFIIFVTVGQLFT